MSNPLKLLNRLIRKNPTNIVVSELYSKMAQPLFVHPHLGEQVMQSYLTALANPEMFRGSQKSEPSVTDRVEIAEGVALIDISGALVARHMEVPCAQSPASYEAIKADMEALLDNSEIHTIIGRFDTPGGVASQNVDLSDFIYSSRGQGTRLIAMVDDMAYSAGFGIASAFDEIWVTRTGGVGSVGVVSYHVDQSEFNKKAGVKVEYIYAGDKKVLGNPHEPLSDEARAVFSKEVQRLYSLFSATVARNLNMSIDDVRATQAGTFHGEEAVEAGFAHKVGTLDELLASLMEKDSANSPEAGKLKLTQESQELNDGEEPSEPSLSDDVEDEDLNKEPSVDLDDVEDDDKEKMEALLAEQEKLHSGIRAACSAAGVPSAAEQFIAANMELQAVRDLLLEITATKEKDDQISSHFVPLSEKQESIDSSWKSAFDKVKGF